MVRFNCMNGWCRRSRIVLDGLPDVVIQRCFSTQTCPLCLNTRPAVPLAFPQPPPRPPYSEPQADVPDKRALDRVGGGNDLGVALKRFKRTHQRLARYIAVRPPGDTPTHAYRLKVTTCDRAERTARAGEDRSDDEGGEDWGSAAGDDDDDAAPLRDDLGFTDVLGLAPEHAVAAEASEWQDGDDDDDHMEPESAPAPSTEQHSTTRDAADCIDRLDKDVLPADDEGSVASVGSAHSVETDAGTAEALEEDDNSASTACIVCLRGVRYPLCKQCASNIRKRARVLLKL